MLGAGRSISRRALEAWCDDADLTAAIVNPEPLDWQRVGSHDSFEASLSQALHEVVGSSPAFDMEAESLFEALRSRSTCCGCGSRCLRLRSTVVVVPSEAMNCAHSLKICVRSTGSHWSGRRVVGGMKRTAPQDTEFIE